MRRELTDSERERYNLPPKGFQGNEMTVIIEAPTRAQMTTSIKAFEGFARSQGMHKVKVVEQGSDPDGGYKAIVQAHNFNPITWASEQAHRAKMGVEHGWRQGAEKAKVKHEISLEEEKREKALAARKRREALEYVG